MTPIHVSLVDVRRRTKRITTARHRKFTMIASKDLTQVADVILSMMKRDDDRYISHLNSDSAIVSPLSSENSDSHHNFGLWALVSQYSFVKYIMIMFRNLRTLLTMSVFHKVLSVFIFVIYNLVPKKISFEITIVINDDLNENDKEILPN